MSTVTDTSAEYSSAEVSPARPRWLVWVLATVMAVALVATGAGLAVATGLGASRDPGEDSVDVGFARDMTTHHSQAVQMAQVVRDRGSDPALRLIAYDIETQQLGQMGQMRGWMQSWGVSEQTDRTPMSWLEAGSGDGSGPGHDALGGMTMHNGLMPGMATTAELTKLRSLSGRPLDVYFLQLMIRHHHGGLPMARYAADHADVDYVRELAGKMVAAQSAEIVTMEQQLRERGGQPLPAS